MGNDPALQPVISSASVEAIPSASTGLVTDAVTTLSRVSAVLIVFDTLHAETPITIAVTVIDLPIRLTVFKHWLI